MAFDAFDVAGVEGLPEDRLTKARERLEETREADMHFFNGVLGRIVGHTLGDLPFGIDIGAGLYSPEADRPHLDRLSDRLSGRYWRSSVDDGRIWNR